MSSWTPEPSYIEKRFLDFYSRMKIPYPLIPQYQIGPYFCDLVNLESGVVIECDGKAYHSSPEQRARDNYRQGYLEGRNWLVIRFSGYDIYHYPVRCVLRAKAVIEQELRLLA